MPDVSSTKNRLEIVEKQFVRQVLNGELDVHRYPLLLPQVGANREVEDGPGTNAATLKIDLVKESRIEALRYKVDERRAGFYIRRHTRVISTIERRIKTRGT